MAMYRAMETRTRVLSNASIVREPLIGVLNYDDWSIQVMTYLKANDLWEVVETDQPTQENISEGEISAWNKRNAAALHAIQISCEADLFSLIKKVSSAKVAWKTLADMCKMKRFSASDNEISDQRRYKPFFDAVYKGNWDEAKEFLNLHPNAVSVKSLSTGETALHVGASAGHLHIVEELVRLMTNEDLEIQRIEDSNTALGVAVDKGNISMAKCMVSKNMKLLAVASLRDFKFIPVVHAALVGKIKMARYLYSVTPLEFLTLDGGESASKLFTVCIYNKDFDLASDIFDRCPHLITAIGKPNSAILALPLSPYPSGCRLKWWQQLIYNFIQVQHHGTMNHFCIYFQDLENDERSGFENSTSLGLLQGMVSSLLTISGIKRIYQMKLAHIQSLELLKKMSNEIKHLDDKQIDYIGVPEAIAIAATRGTIEFVTYMLKAVPQLMSSHMFLRNMFEMALINRQANVFNLIHGIDIKHSITSFGGFSNENMLHVVGHIAPQTNLNHISGAALQMQRELQWFKEVETIVMDRFRLQFNAAMKTPRDVFTESHKDLLIAGEKWMKDTSTSCTVVGALIVTIMFTAAFTIPGGNNEDTGLPIFLKDRLFKVFIISDAMSLFSATTSVLMFLGILTSRYAEEDFLKPLPKKLIIGLSTLFFSIATMMIAFCAALSIMFDKDPWIVVPLISFAIVPVTLFVWMQFSLLVEIFMSTYGPSIFNRNVKNRLQADHHAT